MRCPKIGCKNTLNANEMMNAISRRDNKTRICADCGQQEALEDFVKVIKEKK